MSNSNTQIQNWNYSNMEVKWQSSTWDKQSLKPVKLTRFQEQMRELNFKFFTLCGINKYKVEGFKGEKKKWGEGGRERSNWESSEGERTLEGRRLEQSQSRMGRASSYWNGHSKLSGSSVPCPSYPNSPNSAHSFVPLIFFFSLRRNGSDQSGKMRVGRNCWWERKSKAFGAGRRFLKFIGISF